MACLPGVPIDHTIQIDDSLYIDLFSNPQIHMDQQNKNIQYLLFVVTIFSLLLPLSNSCIGRKNCKEEQLSDMVDERPLPKHEERTVLLLIADDTCSPPTQAIQCTSSKVEHGFVEVIYPYDSIMNSDIIWLPSFEMNDTLYPIKHRCLSKEQKEEIKIIFNKLDALSTLYTYSIRDDYKYILYMDNQKKIEVSEQALNFDDFPADYKIILQEILSMGSPLYPNFGFMIY